MEIGEKIKELRKLNNLSQDSFAEAIGVSRQSVIKWESGKATPKSDVLIVISKTFNIDINELIENNVEGINEYNKPPYRKYIYFKKDYIKLSPIRYIPWTIYFLAIIIYVILAFVLNQKLMLFLLCMLIFVVLGFMVYFIYDLINLKLYKKRMDMSSISPEYKVYIENEKNLIIKYNDAIIYDIDKSLILGAKAYINNTVYDYINYSSDIRLSGRVGILIYDKLNSNPYKLEFDLIKYSRRTNQYNVITYIENINKTLGIINKGGFLHLLLILINVL